MIHPNRKRVLVEDATGEFFSDEPAELFEVFSRDRHSFFLDSGCSPTKLGRYSIIGSEPEFVLRSKDGKTDVESKKGVDVLEKYPLDALDLMLAKNRLEYDGGLPFVGGAVGYLSYDLGWFTEGVELHGVDDVGMLDMEFSFYDKAVVCDNRDGRVWLVSCGETDADCSEGIEHLRERLSSPPKIADKLTQKTDSQLEIKSNFTRDDYIKAVQRIKDYIKAGDTYQVNLSQRFEAEYGGDQWVLYKRLREINPAPFSAYLNFGETKVLSSSPERFLRIRKSVIETRPIKGTRPRGKNEREDNKLADELLASGKDMAEHVMIVDLERNDLGKVCKYGSVRVSEFEVLESYPTVHHLVSTVEGRLRKDVSQVDCIRACFPGGSITGAPKVRAMEIIDELEPCHRGLYTGSVGYLGFDGSMDLNIVIRTMVCKNGRIFFSVGGGVVADSDPEAEYDETIDKARALFQSLGVIV